MTPADRRQLAHPFEMGMALRVDERLDRPPGQDREHDLREQRGLEVRLGIERLVEPALELTRALVGDGVATAFRALGLLDLVDPHAPPLLEPPERRIDLRERDRVVRREVAIDQPLEVIAVPRLLLEKPQEGVRNAHLGGL